MSRLYMHLQCLLRMKNFNHFQRTFFPAYSIQFLPSLFDIDLLGIQWYGMKHSKSVFDNMVLFQFGLMINMWRWLDYSLGHHSLWTQRLTLNIEGSTLLLLLAVVLLLSGLNMNGTSSLIEGISLIVQNWRQDCWSFHPAH